MIFIATVHWADPRWIEVQRSAFDRHIRQPFRVFADLEGIGSAFDGRFDLVRRENKSHPEKLNGLATAIAEVARPEDLIVFVDGDAFPIRPLDQWLAELLSAHRLAAVRRDENAGDRQPHPCFCVCPVGFWTELGGDWQAGPWVTSEGAVASDVGGRLLARLEAGSLPWRPVLRSNQTNLHPVLYGIYEGHIYHHGAGFRPPIVRADQAHVPVAENEDYLFLRMRARGRSLRDLRPRHLGRLARLARGRLAAGDLSGYIREEERRSREIFERIRDDPEFFRVFES